MLRNGDRFKEDDIAAKFAVNVEWGLPGTIILDQNDRIIYIHRGYKPGDEKKLDAEIAHLLELQ